MWLIRPLARKTHLFCDQWVPSDAPPPPPHWEVKGEWDDTSPPHPTIWTGQSMDIVPRYTAMHNHIIKSIYSYASVAAAPSSDPPASTTSSVRRIPLSEYVKRRPPPTSVSPSINTQPTTAASLAAPSSARARPVHAQRERPQPCKSSLFFFSCHLTNHFHRCESVVVAISSPAKPQQVLRCGHTFDAEEYLCLGRRRVFRQSWGFHQSVVSTSTGRSIGLHSSRGQRHCQPQP